MCRLSWNLGTSTSWNPLGLFRPVMGFLYLYLYLTFYSLFLPPCLFFLFLSSFYFYFFFLFHRSFLPAPFIVSFLPLFRGPPHPEVNWPNFHLQTTVRAIWFRAIHSISVYRLCGVNTQQTGAAIHTDCKAGFLVNFGHWPMIIGTFCLFNDAASTAYARVPKVRWMNWEWSWCTLRTIP